MPDLDTRPGETVGQPGVTRSDGTHPADVARGDASADPFPPEGTDEKIVAPASEADQPISEAESLKATKRALEWESPETKGVAVLEIFTTFVSSFLDGLLRTTPSRTCLRADKKLRDNLDEDQIDSMIDDSFPASDPPSSY